MVSQRRVGVSLRNKDESRECSTPNLIGFILNYCKRFLTTHLIYKMLNARRRAQEGTDRRPAAHERMSVARSAFLAAHAARIIGKVLPERRLVSFSIR